jgi:hypothetical protein
MILLDASNIIHLSTDPDPAAKMFVGGLKTGSFIPAG